MRILLWAALAAASAWAASLVVVHSTPIDEALPYLAIIATLLAAVSYPSLTVAVPLLMVTEIAVFDERTRLMLFGAILACEFGAALLSLMSRIEDRGSRVEEVSGVRINRLIRPSIMAVAAIFLLRWIPLGDVLLVRELAIIAIALGIVRFLGGTPFAVAVAVCAAFVTPAVPLRTFVLPLLVLAASFIAGIAGATRLRLLWPSAAAVGIALVFFAWSGVAARALPSLLRPEAGHTAQSITAIPPGESLVVDVPRGAKAVVLSGANVASLERGTVIGRIEPGGVVVRIGDAADWGGTRREHFHRSRNGVPAHPAGRLRGYGYNAWVDGAGRVTLPPNDGRIRLTASGDLPPGASLQLEGFDAGAR